MAKAVYEIDGHLKKGRRASRRPSAGYVRRRADSNIVVEGVGRCITVFGRRDWLRLRFR
jgi:hypothetical protein